jgi:hypothetical protein
MAWVKVGRARADGEAVEAAGETAGVYNREANLPARGDRDPMVVGKKASLVR